MQELTIRKLAEYCRDYVDLVSPSAFARSDKRIQLPADIFSAEPLLNNVAEMNYDEQIVLPISFTINVSDLSLESEETDGEVHEKVNRDLKIARDLDDIQRKFETNSYTKQLSLQFGKISFQGFPNFDDEDIEIEENGRKSAEGFLFSIPIIINYQDSRGHRNYDVRIDDTFIKTNIGFLKNYLKLEYRDELYKFIAKDANQENTGIPMNPSYVDELWSKITTYLEFSDAIEISITPDMSNVVIILEPKANYFLSQDLYGIIQTADDDALRETSLSAWIDKDGKYINDIIDDSGEYDLFFPFAYDKYQLNVLSKIKNKGLIVEGPPGTGKSQTISNILVHLAAIGEKVLFVSQKDQAVRGVKDKLKSLNIPLLFGYIPDRSSRLHTDEDERDGASYALRGISQAHLNSAKEQNPKKFMIEIKEEVQSFNNQIAETRAFVHLYDEWKALEEFDFSENNSKITLSWYGNILELRGNIVTLRKEITKQQSESDIINRKIESTKKQSADVLATIRETSLCFRKMVNYEWLQNEQEYLRDFSYENLAETTHNVIGLFQKIALDRKVSVISHMWNKRKLSKEIEEALYQLPLELYETYKAIVFSDATKTERRIALEKIEEYFTSMAQFQKDYTKVLEDIKYFEFEKGNILKDLVFAEASVGKLNAQLNSEMLEEISMGRLEELYKMNKTDIFEKIHRRHILDIEVKNQINFNPNGVREEIMRKKQDYDSQVKNYIKNRVSERAKIFREKKQYRATLESIAWKLSKTKKAYKTFDSLKSDAFNFEAMSAVTPIWMMGLDDASRILPLQPNLFDYVIIDEASQCNISYTLPVMYRARHAVFFGDTLQMRDATIAFKSNNQLLSLAYKHSIPEELQIKAEGDSVKSVMDIAKLNGFETIALKRHYRSPLEIIGFSNEHFYAPKNRKLEVVNDDILATDDGRVLKTHLLQSNSNIETSPKTNITEAVYIKELIEKIKANDRTKDKSIAVLSFFNEQAELLRRIIPDKDVKISTIEGIQGDERDIVIFSFVISSPEEKNRYIALTGESGEMRKEINEGRVNVAFSRARLQVHAVTSLDPNYWPEGVWIKKYLKYIEEHGRVRRLSKADQHFDSYFEEEVYNFLMQKLDLNDFRVTTQVESCGFKIDQVITNVKSGKKLAIECDGPTHFDDGNGQVRVENDFERQYVLEMAHWVFYRISYIDWQRNQETLKKNLLVAISNHFMTVATNNAPKDETNVEVEIYKAISVEIPVSILEKQKSTNASIKSRSYFGQSSNVKRNIEKKAYKQVEFKMESTNSKNIPNKRIGKVVIGNKDYGTESDINPENRFSNTNEIQHGIGPTVKGINQLSIDQLDMTYNNIKEKRVQLPETWIDSSVLDLKEKSIDHAIKESAESKQSEDIITNIQKAEIRFIDKRSNGGALWIIGGQELEGFVEECIEKNVSFKFKPGGGRATSGKDAWWAK